MSDLYYEEYDDQHADEFSMVGVAGETPVPINDLERQVNELRRLRGNHVTIYVYRPSSVLR